MWVITMMNKKGQTVVNLFTLIAVALTFGIILGSFLFFFDTLDTALGNNLIAGQVNLSNASSQTVGKINTGFVNGADLIGIFFLFGFVLAIMISGFVMRNETPKLLFMVDFILIIFAYILAVYISNAYESILAVLPFSDLMLANLNNTSRFVLFLPQITVITGFVTMILTYSGIPRSRDEAEVAGF